MTTTLNPCALVPTRPQLQATSNLRQLRRAVLACAVTCALTPLLALAQSSHAADAAQLDAVKVTGVRASIQKSLVDKRNAVGVVDAIAAEDMGKFPDINLSESLQRIPGITLDRNNVGEAGCTAPVPSTDALNAQ